jgi:DNA polymerase I-like protein with 3'-5' exonuclease and polymerase domains
MTQLPLFRPSNDWRPPAVGSLPSWAGAKRVSIDVETRDPHLKRLGPGVRRGAYIVGLSFAIEDGPDAYLPLRHEGGDNLPVDAVLGYLKDQAASFTGDICGANLQYDLDFLAEVGTVFRSARFFRDCQVAEPLLDELQHSYSLESIAERHGIPGKTETALRDAASAWGIDPKTDLWKLPARYVASYAVQDVRLPLTLLRRQERRIEEQGLWGVYDLESRILPILVKMRRRGVKIDTAKLSKVEEWSEINEKECWDKLHAQTGVRVNVGDAMKVGPLAKALKTVGIEVPVTPTTRQPSIDKDFLKAQKHPVAQLIDRARKISKLRTTFAASIRQHMVNGRIHCTFNQLRKTDDGSEKDGGARYGRLSSVDPNLQQQPSRGEWAPMWRSIYIPDDGLLWAAADFSSQEPRLCTHYAAICRCDGAAVAAKKYHDDPNTDNHAMMARIIHGMRDDEVPEKHIREQAKTIFLAVCYGMGGAKLAKSLGLSTMRKQIRDGKTIEVAGPEAQAIIDKFDAGVPYVRQLANMCQRKAARVGFIKTISGRRCRFPRNPVSGLFDWTHKALNRLIQGSAADQTKTAMVVADAAGFRMQLQVHDEIDLSVKNKEEALELANIMRTCVPLAVPSKVDVDVGPSWGEAK